MVLFALTLLQLALHAARQVRSHEHRPLLTARRGPAGWHWTDFAAYAYLLLGVVLMFGPVLWLVLSSFKTPGQPARISADASAHVEKEVVVPGYRKPLPLFTVTMADGSERVTGAGPAHRHPGADGRPAEPDAAFRVPIDKRQPVREFALATEQLHRAASAASPFCAFSATPCSSPWSRR